MDNPINDIDFIDFKCSSRDLYDDFKDLLIEYGLDYCTIISITQNTAVRLITISTEDDFEVQYEYAEFLSYDVEKNNSVYRACVSGKAFFNNNITNVKPYFKANNSELFIPVKIDNELIACIGLSSIDKNEFVIDSNKISIIFSKHYCYINEIKSEKILNKNIINYITLVDKLYYEKMQFMIQHSYNVASWASELAVEMGYNKKKVRSIYLAGLIHDIGKIYIDSEIVNKEGVYTKEEYLELKKHAKYSYNICKELFLGYHDNISLWVEQHHEKWDGTGYPNSISGNKITEEGRILKIADSLDGMLSLRNFKTKMTTENVINELKDFKRRDFDPYIVDCAISVLSKKMNIKNNVVDDFLKPADLIFETKEKFISFDGYISKANDELMFYANDDVDIEHTGYKSIILGIEKLNVISEYSVTIERFNGKTITIGKISEKEHEKSFNLLWILDGFLVDIHTRVSTEIIITKLSANGISFKVAEENQDIDIDQTYLTKIIFEDKTTIVVMGKPVRYVMVNNVYHYELVFVNIKEDVQSKIFHQLFQKQISMRSFL